MLTITESEPLTAAAALSTDEANALITLAAANQRTHRVRRPVGGVAGAPRSWSLGGRFD